MNFPFLPPLIGLAVGLAGFLFIGLGLVYVADGRRFKEQSQKAKRITVLLAFAQWPYFVLAGLSLIALVKGS